MRHQNHLRDRPERTHVEEDASGIDGKAVDGVARNRREVAMAQHDRLGRAGGAAAEVQGREILAVDRRLRLGGSLLQQCLVGEILATAADHNNVSEAFDLGGEPRDLLGERRMRDQDRYAGMAQQCDKLRAGEARIERHPHEARGHDAVVGLQIFADIGKEQRDAVAPFERKTAQRIPEPKHARVKVAIAPGAVRVAQCGSIGMLVSERAPDGADMIFGDQLTRHVTNPAAPRDR